MRQAGTDPIGSSRGMLMLWNKKAACDFHIPCIQGEVVELNYNPAALKTQPCFLNTMVEWNGAPTSYSRQFLLWLSYDPDSHPRLTKERQLQLYSLVCPSIAQKTYSLKFTRPKTHRYFVIAIPCIAGAPQKDRAIILRLFP
jgi:hypothetical protein